MSTCQTCLPIDCVPDDDFDYSIDRRTQLYDLVTDCPAGAVCIQPGVKVRMQCCDHWLELKIPNGATIEQAKALLFDLNEQCRQMKELCQKGSGGDTGERGDDDKKDDPSYLCFSDPVCKEVYCSDGYPFRYCLPAGAFVAESCLEANANAALYALNMANRNKICLSSLPNGCVGKAYSGSIVASGLPLGTSNIWQLTAGALPTGLSMTTGLVAGLVNPITGTPTTIGDYSFKVKVIAPNGAYMEKSFTITVLNITTSSPLTGGSIGIYYSTTLAMTGGTVPLQWDIISGALPAGLSLEPVIGTIAGTPTEGGSFTFTVQCTDADDLVCSKEFTLNINALLPDLWWSFLGDSYEDVRQSVLMVDSGTSFIAGKTGLNKAVDVGVPLSGFYKGVDTGLVPELGYAYTSDLTVCLWFKVNTVPKAAPAPDLMALFDLLFDGTSGEIIVNLLNSGAIRAYIGGPSTSATDTWAFTPGTDWHFLLANYEQATGVLSVYVDNVLLGQLAPVSLASALSGDLLSEISGGSIPQGAMSVDEIGVFINQQLTTDDFDFLWNSGDGVTYPW